MTDVETKVPGLEEETPETDPETGKAKENGEGLKSDTPGSEGKVEKKEPGEEGGEVPEVTLKGLTQISDGRFEFSFGGSKYYGKTPEEAIEEAEKGIQGKNQSYQKTQEELKRLKAQTSIREPEEEQEAELPPQPQLDDFVRQVFSKRGLDVKMLSFTEDDWDKYQDDNNLRERRIVAMQSDIAAARQEAQKQYYAADTKWFNLGLVKKELTPAVRELVAESGLEPDEFGTEYDKLLRDPAMRFKDGEINATAILKAMSKKIVEKLKSQGTSSSELEKEKKRLQQELEERKKSLQDGSSRTTKITDKNKQSVKNLQEAFDPERWKKVLAET